MIKLIKHSPTSCFKYICIELELYYGFEIIQFERMMKKELETIVRVGRMITLLGTAACVTSVDVRITGKNT